MINREHARKYCCEKISLIENYEEAKKDLIQTWDLHHRKEEEGYSRQKLKELGLYLNRPASELIFLTHSEHMKLHRRGKRHSAETKKKMSEAKKGKTGEEHNSSKPVQQIDKKTGQVIRTWPCANEAQRALWIAQPSISACCSGKRKSAGGYVWRYAG